MPPRMIPLQSNLNYPNLEPEYLTVRGLRKFPCISLPSRLDGSQKEIAVGAEERLSTKAQRRAVKIVAKDTDTAINNGINPDQQIPFEERKLAYQQTLLHTNERLQRLRALSLSPEPPGFSLSRATKNKAALAVGAAGVAGSVGLGAAGVAVLLAASPVTAVIGTVAGAVVGPFSSDIREMGPISDCGPVAVVASPITGAVVGGTLGLLSPGLLLFQIVTGDGRTSKRMHHQVINALNTVNYMPEARLYVNRPRLSTKEIADITHDKLNTAFDGVGMHRPETRRFSTTASTSQVGAVTVQSTSTAPQAETSMASTRRWGFSLRPNSANPASTSSSVNAATTHEPAAGQRAIAEDAAEQRVVPQTPVQTPSEATVVQAAPPFRQVQGARTRGNWRFPEREDNAAAFNAFSRKLTQTAEYKHDASRKQLIARVDSLVDAMHESPPLRRICFQVAADSLSSCNDRIALALEDMEMAKINYDAEKGSISNIQLFSLGESMFKIDVLDQIALKKIASLQKKGIKPDQIEVRLFYHTALAKELQLPSIANSMLHRELAPVSADDLSTAAREIRTLLKTNESVEALVNWQPWAKAMQRTHPGRYAELDRVNAQIRDGLAIKPTRMSEQQWIESFEIQKKSEQAQRKNLTAMLTHEFIQANNLG